MIVTNLHDSSQIVKDFHISGHPDADKSLIDKVLREVEDLSVAEAGELLGVSHESVARWRRGDWKRLHPETRRALALFLKTRAELAHDSSRVPRGTMTIREAAAKYAASGGRVDQLMEMLGRPDMLRRMVGVIPKSDLGHMLAGYAAVKLEGDERERALDLAKWLIEDEENGS